VPVPEETLLARRKPPRPPEFRRVPIADAPLSGASLCFSAGTAPKIRYRSELHPLVYLLYAYIGIRTCTGIEDLLHQALTVPAALRKAAKFHVILTPRFRLHPAGDIHRIGLHPRKSLPRHCPRQSARRIIGKLKRRFASIANSQLKVSPAPPSLFLMIGIRRMAEASAAVASMSSRLAASRIR